MNSHIKVLLVDDSPISLAVQKRILSKSDQIEVVGTALNGLKALEKIPKLNPNVICTDLYMPKMDGLEFTKEVMKKFPRPILVVSTGVQKSNQENVFRLLEAGAVDVFPKPKGEEFALKSDYNTLFDAYIQRIIAVSRARIQPKEKIKTLLVDDSPIALAIQKRMLANAVDIEIVGTALNALKALEMIPKLEPSVICTDFHMPKMNGLEFTKEVMKRFPIPILVVSTAVQEEDKENVFQLIEAGAVDVFPKPRTGFKLKANAEYNAMGEKLIEKIRTVSNVSVDKKSQASGVSTERSDRSPSTKNDIGNSCKAVVIGASTGGPQALKKLLKNLPNDYPVPIFCIQHLSEEFRDELRDWLAENCQMEVQIAELGKRPTPGTIYFPQKKSHLEIDSDGRFACFRTRPFKGYRPSISIAFESASEYYGKDILAILLTGMGSDGAEGMKLIKRIGGTTIAQDEESSIVFDMPRHAIKLGAAQHVLSLNDIAGILTNIGNQ
jgi:two-component system chemotaxis response regulator CheB